MPKGRFDSGTGFRNATLDMTRKRMGLAQNGAGRRREGLNSWRD